MVGEWKKLSRDCDREKFVLDLEDKTSTYSTLKCERKLIAGEGKNKERRDAERERGRTKREGTQRGRERKKQDKERERGRKKRRGERRGRERKKSRRETEREKRE